MLYATIREIWEQSEDRLNKEEVSAVYAELKKLTKVSQEVRQAHVERIKERYGAEKKAVKKEAGETLQEVAIDDAAVTAEEAKTAEKFEELDKPERIEEAGTVEVSGVSTKAETDEELKTSSTSTFKAPKSAAIPEAFDTPDPAAPPEVSEKSGTPADASPSETPQELDAEALICPRCGGRLVLRVAKKGANAGNSFYGCSNFPKCRYIK